MPMPRLLKRLSQKSLRKRTKSTSSVNGDVQFEVETPPPVPDIPKSAASDVSFGVPVVNGTPVPSHLDKATPTTPKTPNGVVSLNESPPALPIVVVNGNDALAVNGNAIPQDDLSLDLQAAWKSASTDPKASKADKALQKLENSASGLMAKEAKGATMVVAVKTGLDAIGGVEAIEAGLNKFMEGMPVLMNALDEVAKLHPFIGVAVMAFKAVWALEQKRRDNDKKILMLHMEMKDMMGVLTQLKNVQDADAIAPDGTTIHGRMQIIVKSTAEDIKACANACDTYTKKKLVVKVLKGPVWEGKLAAFAGTFTKRRSEFEFAMSIHTALGVDAANRAISNVDATTQAMNEKLESMMKMFAQLVSPEQKEMARLVDQKGGQACMNNDRALKELNEYENKLAGTQGTSATHGGKAAKPADLGDLKDELHSDLEAAIEQNMSVFTRKFEVQQRQLLDEINRAVERQGDRIIGAITSGPGDKIIDPNVHAVWKEMNWRGSIKARNFVMGLRDHFQEEHKGTHTDAEGEVETHLGIQKEDEWALEYLSVVRLQAITEAFDDDASGFVTVGEVNAFTTARPRDWSLPRWIAYWAIGQHQTMQIYANKIKELLGKLFAILPDILPANKSAANIYLGDVHDRVYMLADSVNECYINTGLQERFQFYVDTEEQRLRGNLEAVQYDIDAPDTLALVTGDGRIDRYVMPVIYLLLEQHFEIFRACQKHELHGDELWDAADTIEFVFDAVNVRLELLRSIFKQQKLDLKQQFKSFSFGLFEYWNEPALLWDPKLVQEAEFVEYTYNDSVEKQDVDLSKILNYPYDQERLDFAALAPAAVATAPDGTNSLEVLPSVADLFSAPWHGFFFNPKTVKHATAGMLSFTLVPSSVEGEVHYFTASERANRTEYTLRGECRTSDKPSIVNISFKRTFRAVYWTQYFNGTWDREKETLSGTFGFAEDPKTHSGVFAFKRMDPELVCLYPAPVELEANKARALWGFAIAAVRYQVCRDRWSWSLFKERRDNRLRFMELYLRGGSLTAFGPPLSGEERDEFNRIKKTLTTAQSRWYHSIADARINAMTNHNADCDSCGGPIGGARITCLICLTKDTFDTVDFDDTPSCIAARVMRDDMIKPHLPHHDMMKVRRVVHTRQFGKTYRDAKEALKHARTFFESPASQAEDTDQSESDSGSDTEDEGGHAPVAANRMSRISALAVSIPRDAPSPSLGPMSAVSTARSQVPVPAGPLCCNCKQPAVQPCWYCVQCGDETFICWECDAKGEVSFGDHDIHTHDLVRVQELVEEKDFTLEERLAEMEARLVKHEQTMEARFAKNEQTMEERLTQLETAMGGRMATVEQLLQQVLMKLGPA